MLHAEQTPSVTAATATQALLSLRKLYLDNRFGLMSLDTVCLSLVKAAVLASSLASNSLMSFFLCPYFLAILLDLFLFFFDFFLQKAGFLHDCQNFVLPGRVGPFISLISFAVPDIPY